MEHYEILKNHYDAFHLFLKEECKRYDMDIEFNEDFTKDIKTINGDSFAKYIGKTFTVDDFTMVIKKGYVEKEKIMEIVVNCLTVEGDISVDGKSWPFNYKSTDYDTYNYIETKAPIYGIVNKELNKFLQELVI
jgi:hypothetical protein